MHVVVVSSGELDASDGALLGEADLVIAADGGARSLDLVGHQPDVVVGDLDSTDASLVRRLEAAGVRIERHPADKEASDTELAIEAANAAGATGVVMIGAIGGQRADHELANLLLLCDPGLAGHDLRVVRGGTCVRALHAGAQLTLAGSVGDLVSLLPVGGDAGGVTTDGLRWPLAAATLHMGRSRGLSNEIVAPLASVQISTGTLLVIETAARAAHG